MKIVINNATYSEIKNIRFDSEADITGGDLPINEFAVEIKTNSTISTGQYAYLRDNNNRTYAKYWIVAAERYSDQVITITCQSDIAILQRANMPAVRYLNKNAGTVIREIFSNFGLSVVVDSTLSEKTLNGYCPAQTARERLQLIVFCIGGYVQTDFVETTTIKAVDDTSVGLILDENIYYRPTISYNDIVTKIIIYYYRFVEGYPRTTDEWVSVINSNEEEIFYIKTAQTIELSNPEADEDTPENVVEINEITLINEDNISELSTRLSTYYFKRTELKADIINEGEFLPGEKCHINSGIGNIVTGYIRNCDFSFGKKTKTTITVSQADIRPAGSLVILYYYNGTEIQQREFSLPVGYLYDIKNFYIDKIEFVGVEEGSIQKIYSRIIYYPLTASATGTIGSEVTIDEQDCEIALRRTNNLLEIFNVDEVSAASEDESVVRIK